MKDIMKGKPGGTVSTPGTKPTAGKPGSQITTPGVKPTAGKPGGTMSWVPKSGT